MAVLRLATGLAVDLAAVFSSDLAAGLAAALVSDLPADLVALAYQAT